MTAELISLPSTTRRARWGGRASQLRRQQVGSSTASEAQVAAVWSSMVEVLRAMDAPSCAVLCTTGGGPRGAPGGAPAAGARGAPAGPPPGAEPRRVVAAPVDRGAETVALIAGRRHTVIASVPGEHADHLLSVTAEGVSAPLLEAWTRRAAEDLGDVLSGLAIE